ncbi:uncharacterized protein CEXT_333261, partial [Caerostris extrusa]
KCLILTEDPRIALITSCHVSPRENIVPFYCSCPSKGPPHNFAFKKFHLFSGINHPPEVPQECRNFPSLSLFKKGMIPEPDYGDSKECEGKRNSRVCSTNGMRFSEDGLVIPKKPQNPCLESSERQNLHRELLFNQKYVTFKPDCQEYFWLVNGKSVIGQKTELHKAFDKLREDQKKKELEEEKLQKKSALEKKLEEQANKLKQQEEIETKKIETTDQPEFLRVHARVCAQTVDSKS